MNTLGLPMVTIGLAQGDALGGGFESLLSFNVIIAERNAKFGFPETMFGLFPGMGAYSLVSRRVGAAFAEEMMLTGRIYSAEEMQDVGLVHLVVDPGQGIEAARDYMQKQQAAPRRRIARCTKLATWSIRSRSRNSTPSCKSGPTPACNCASAISKVMQRLVAAQDKLQYTTQAAE